MNSLHGLLNCEICELDGRVITTEYKTRAHCIHKFLQVYLVLQPEDHRPMWYIHTITGEQTQV